MRFKSGHGFEGVLLMEGKTSQVQCHFCGEWFDQLQHHLRREHSMTCGQYKELTGLRQNTALIGEAFREKLCHAGLDKRKANLRPGVKKTKEQAEKTAATQRKQRTVREQQNTMGTCPDQLIDRLRKLKEKLGHQPSNKECGFDDTIISIFGSYSEGLRRAGMIPRKPGGKVKATNEDILKELARFRKAHGRWPSYSDDRRDILMYRLGSIHKRFKSRKRAYRLAKAYLSI